MEQIGETEKELRKIKEEIINCQKCPLFKTRIYPVVGEGNHKAKIIFIGEAPGANEDRTGRPFCGRAGEVLDKLLAGIGIRREDVYICNLLKCRPPGNRDPKPEEIEACSPYLMRQIKLINPQVICP
ncbi:uracil-DNA glycosylase, partial [bacterium]|nr:uracil-DNA glycosylase [bacterium]